GLAEPGLHQRDDVRRVLRPQARARGIDLEVVAKLVVVRARHGEVSGQQVEESRDVRRSLDAGVAPQGEDAAAGAPDIAEQELDDRGGPDVLRAGRVLCPAHRVAERAGALASGARAEQLANLQERLLRYSADLRPGFGRV